MTRRLPTLRRLAALGVAASFGVAACSSDGGPAASTPADASSTGPSSSTGGPSSTGPTGSATPTTSGGTQPATSRATPGVSGGRQPADPVVDLTPVLNVDRKDVGTAVDLATRTGDPAIYIVSQDGIITRVVDGQPVGAVLDITDLTDAQGEQGLLGLAFAPDGTKGYVYYNATDDDGAVTIAEYAVGTDGTFDDSTRRALLSIDHPQSNHNGGALRFGPDGYLYIGVGDGGGQNDPDRRALDTGDLLGKLLRIDPAPAPDGAPYTIPADNPFVAVSGARPELWSIGLRNPWRINFDRDTDDLWIADVGQDRYEEIDVAWANEGSGRGASYGWSAREGRHDFNDDQSDDGAVDPVYEYEHGDNGCSISGGTRYRGSANPTLVGWYVYGDYCSGRIWALPIDENGAALTPVQLAFQDQVVAIDQDAAGELYVLTLDGPVLRIDP